ncbi:MAG: protein-glutamate O-methyltransferase CheR [Gammaproteobacteria bacterium]|nr:MAG: protein-glutamate O-methyltransferase CheR [Gammaproteobacteria bacterium]
MAQAGTSFRAACGVQITDADYRRFRARLEELSGILLGEDKKYLVASRLSRLMEDYGMSSLGELVERLSLPAEQELRTRVIEAMTTNETSWFRDGYPFEILAAVILPEWQSRGIRRPRIWSAACSTGQEPYSISMVVSEYLERHPGAFEEVDILATDIDGRALDVAREARYDELSIQRGLSQQRLSRFFVREGRTWRVQDTVRRRVAFRRMNLQAGAVTHRFEAVFCRNVLIYFAPETKRRILQRIAGAMRPGGYLFPGASESISQYSDAFEMVRTRHGIHYRLR